MNVEPYVNRSSLGKFAVVGVILLHLCTVCSSDISTCTHARNSIYSLPYLACVSSRVMHTNRLAVSLRAPIGPAVTRVAEAANIEYIGLYQFLGLNLHFHGLNCLQLKGHIRALNPPNPGRLEAADGRGLFDIRPSNPVPPFASVDVARICPQISKPLSYVVVLQGRITLYTHIEILREEISLLMTARF